MHPLRFGLKLAPQHTTIDELRAVWRVADDAGFDHVWNFDHFAAIAGEPDQDVFEGWTLLGGDGRGDVARAHRLHGHRQHLPPPGACWPRWRSRSTTSRAAASSSASARPGPRSSTRCSASSSAPSGQRIARLDEALRDHQLLFTEDRATFEGRYYQLTDAIANPKPVQSPHPPIWIGGSGERKTLRVVAEHADVWNVAGGDPDEAARLSAVLDRHCADVGRDPEAIRRSVQIRYVGDDDALLQNVEAVVQRGFTEIVIYLHTRGQAERESTQLAGLLERLRSVA